MFKYIFLDEKSCLLKSVKNLAVPNNGKDFYPNIVFN